MRFRVLFLLVAFILAPASLKAQNYKTEIFGGYQYADFARLNSFAGGEPNIKGNGFTLSGSRALIKWFGVKADFSGAFGTDSHAASILNGPVHLFTYTFGPVISAKAANRIRPFAEFLVGGYHQSSLPGLGNNDGLAILAGGGVDVRARRHLALRLLEIDWLETRVHTPSSGTPPFPVGDKNFRLSTGLTFRF